MKVVYDITTAGIDGSVWYLVFLGVLFMTFAGLGQLMQVGDGTSRSHRYGSAIVGMFFLLILAAVLISGLTKRSACMDALRMGDFQTTTGELSSLKRTGRSVPFRISFEISEQSFELAAGQCGYAPAPQAKFLFKNGQKLRVDHQGGQVFRITVLESLPYQ